MRIKKVQGRVELKLLRIIFLLLLFFYTNTYAQSNYYADYTNGTDDALHGLGLKQKLLTLPKIVKGEFYEAH